MYRDRRFLKLVFVVSVFLVNRFFSARTKFVFKVGAMSLAVPESRELQDQQVRSGPPTSLLVGQLR